MGNLILRWASHLDAFSVYPFPYIATQRCSWQNQLVHSGKSTLVLSYYGADPLKFPTPATDRDRTVSRRSEPSSRAALMGEQPNPWDDYSPRMRRADIEVPNLPVDVNSWGR